MVKMKKQVKCSGRDGVVSCPNNGMKKHTCPYKSDVFDDQETKCNCCESCQQNCCMEV
jgi:hypothetical protein